MICLVDRRWDRLEKKRAHLQARMLVMKSAIMAEAHRLGLCYADAIRLAKEAA